jgi:putative transposase
MGIRNLATTSDGKRFDNLRSFEKSMKKIARLQRQVSRKSKDGKNREKARIRLALAYERAVNQKTDTLQKITTRLVNEYDVICVRNEQIIEKMKNPFFAKYMSDAGWGEFVKQLTYKCEWYDKHLVKISNWHPSAQLCSSCGHQNPEVNKKKFLREWDCSNCSTRHNRAINAARNILAEGMRQ